MSAPSYNPRMENCRKWECNNNHGSVIIIGPEADLVQVCPLCEERLSRSSPILICWVIDCPFPFVPALTLRPTTID